VTTSAIAIAAAMANATANVIRKASANGSRTVVVVLVVVVLASGVETSFASGVGAAIATLISPSDCLANQSGCTSQ
jgi:hypothetical protein